MLYQLVMSLNLHGTKYFLNIPQDLFGNAADVATEPGQHSFP